MSETIDSFKIFFKINKEKEEFFIIVIINKALNLLEVSLNINNIKVAIKDENNIKLFSFKRKFTQVVFNIINNAKDILIKRNIKNPKISINLHSLRKLRA